MLQVKTLPDQLQILFQYSGDPDNLIKQGINIQSMFGVDCYAALIDPLTFKELQKDLNTFRVIYSSRPKQSNHTLVN